MRSFHYTVPGFLLASVLFVAVPTASATTIPLNLVAFGAGSTLTTFTGLADGTEVNGLSVDGLLFQYSLGNGALIIDGGPGDTNNVTTPNLVSIGDPTGILTVFFPSLIDTFGYGFAIQDTTSFGNATTITLFNGAVAVGSLSYGAAPDPAFSGGFAGIQSTLSFDRAQLTFAGGTAFAADDFRTAVTNPAAVPEPTTLLLLGTGLVASVVRRRRRV